MTETATLTLTEFLLARYDEDEATAQECKGRDRWLQSAPSSVETIHGIPIANAHRLATAHIARHDPARVLADIKAKRQLLAAYEDAKIARNAATTDPQQFMTFAAIVMALWPPVAALALPFADHPDYRPEWRP